MLSDSELVELLKQLSPHNRQSLLRHQEEPAVFDGFFECKSLFQHLANIVAVGVRISVADYHRAEKLWRILLGNLELLEGLSIFGDLAEYSFSQTTTFFCEVVCARRSRPLRVSVMACPPVTTE